ncbi:tRNA-I(6)A37 thiotransferase enzyme MiaB [Acetobacterium bakii]|uniref:Ribosomal protein uS12 methylthiotransferase RimO n=2 Tax=Acetobacterium bakii TaxID=52689 RepID=A0A0L6TZL7_9FIRM|nr:tRNA-I(6)A37 thiotransferase enzyme MiaB [Acetobacterium bakii]
MTTLGCDKNTIDSQLMLGLIQEKEYSIQEDPKDAEIIIVNTCCFIQEAKEQSIDYILEYAKYKESGRCEILIVAGCMAERYHTELNLEIPEIDGFLGVGHFENIIDLLNNFENTEHNKFMGDIDKECVSDIKRFIPKGSVSAFLRISEGCDHGCTYCVIPKIRGKYRSRKSQDIFKELSYLQENGIKEIVLIGQDIAPYGQDLKEGFDLPSLLERIALNYEFDWIRMMYLYPEGITPELLRVVAEYPSICNYFDIPLQHTADPILKRMGRKMTLAKIEDITALIRNMIPDAVLRTSIITGFPGETDLDHQTLLQAIKALEFDHLGAFKYSQEEDTPAASFENQISDDTKDERYKDIMMTQQEISLKKNQHQVGRVLKVLIEGIEEESYIGRCYGDAPEIDGTVFVDSKGTALIIGNFYPVKIVNALEYDLIGDIENEFTK